MEFTSESSKQSYCGAKNVQSIEQLIAGIGAKHPERIAIIDGQQTISYGQLNQRANDIAAMLVQHEVETGALVAVCLKRHWSLCAALLGILRAGCAYVPVDVAYPKARVDYILKHSKAAAAIVEDIDGHVLCENLGTRIDLNHCSLATFEAQRPHGPDALAYVIYTSGTEGTPKGVALSHQSLLALSKACDELLDEEDRQGVLAATSICFDPSVMEILATLSIGGKVILAQNILALPQLPAFEQVRTCITVPSAMQALLGSNKLPASLRLAVFGGEVLKPVLIEALRQQKQDLRIVNVYGPTEDTVFSTVKEIGKSDAAVTIGRPVTNSRAYILDKEMRPVDVAVAAELYLSGDKLALGYLNDAVLTAQRFVTATIDSEIGPERLYRTGDLCQWTAEGEIAFLGRVDQQVKIRGFRIELEEIESTLERMPGVNAVGAVAIEGGMGQKLLAVYMVCEQASLGLSQVKSYLAERLPPYMVPHIVKQVASLPYLPNGKLDRQQLSTIDSQSQDCTIADVPSAGINESSKDKVLVSQIKQALAGIVAHGSAEQISANASFDSLGLDSLTLVELKRRLDTMLHCKLPFDCVSEHSTVVSLATNISRYLGTNLAQTSDDHSTGSAPDSLAKLQHQLQLSHPTFQAAKAATWSASDKGILVEQLIAQVNDKRRNPYSKVLRTGSATKGKVADAYNDEERDAIIWTTNLYLGLNRDPQIIAKAQQALQQFGTGMGTSAAASGLTDLHLKFERNFAELVGKPAACLFPTGYTANVGAVAGLLGENDVVIIDQLCHASIVDGARLCGATVRTFKHNDAADLETVLDAESSPYRTVLVVIEGVYSMGEGAAPVAEIVRMAKKHGALVLVDEAHSFGFYGERGAGICQAQGVSEEVDFIMTTLSKSMGSLGGVIAASQQHIDLLKSASRAYIFQASVSPADIAAALGALEKIREDDSLRQRLWETARYMRAQFSAAGFDLGCGDGPIVTPHFADKDKLYAIVQSLYQKGVQTSAVTYPIVEVGRGRLRFICSAAHTKADVDLTLAALIAAEKEVDNRCVQKPKETNTLDYCVNDVRRWAGVFADYLQRTIDVSEISVPELAINIELGGQLQMVSIVIKQGRVSLDDNDNIGLAQCRLTLNNNHAANALCCSEVKALLESICDGSCQLNGQTEPFIWFIARMVQQQEQAKPFVLHTEPVAID